METFKSCCISIPICALGDRTILISSNGSDWNGYTFDIINGGNGEVFLSSDYDTSDNRFLAY